MLEFVDSGLYFVQDENNFINPLLQVGSGSNEKSTGPSGSKINGSGALSLEGVENIKMDTNSPVPPCILGK